MSSRLHALRRAKALIVLALLAGCASSNASDLGAGPLPTATAQTAPSSTASSSNRSTLAPTPTDSAAAGADPRLTLPPGAALPSDLECAGRVVQTREVRPGNTPFNQARGRQKNIPEKWLDRVTGDFSGTTEEIMQWAACKWGIDLDIVRAQAAKESYWHMTTLGDWGTDSKSCPPKHPIGADGRPGQCPESVGVMQARYAYSGPPAGMPTWPELEESTAYNLDFTYANWRSCYEGDKEWLNTVDRGRQYAAGDAWGCVGTWFTGRWYLPAGNQYINDVQAYAKARIWTSSSFINAR